VGIGVWRVFALRPGLYRLSVRLALPMLRLFARRGWIASMPLAGGWTRYRDFPAPARLSFMDQIERKRR
jgi:L-lactate dehydrogenase complex protein LldF